MGGGCYRGMNREMVVVGAWCENECFSQFGGCEASMSGDITKPTANCELRPEEPTRLSMTIDAVVKAIAESTEKGRELFLYTPDMFQEFYLKECFWQLPDQAERTYLAVNAGVRSFIDSGIGFGELTRRGIREMWVGVESGSPVLRERYGKPAFTNDEVFWLTDEGRKNGVNVCWFLVDGVLDTDASKLETYNLMRRCEPYRVEIGTLQRYERVA